MDVLEQPGKRHRLEEGEDSNGYKIPRQDEASAYWKDKPVGFVIPQPVVREGSGGDMYVSNLEKETLTENTTLKDFEVEGLEQSSSDSEDSCVQRDGSFMSQPEPCQEGSSVEDRQAMDKVAQSSQPHGRAMVELPEGKRCHTFISHSTSDRVWAEKMVCGLSSNWKVRACYEFMPDPSRYEDNDILAYMRYSCVIVVGISPAYVHSNRCVREWRSAVELSERYNVGVIVASVVEGCSRPPPLKKFLYLDFVDNVKYQKVWDVLQENIRQGVKHFQQVSQTKDSPFSHTTRIMAEEKKPEWEKEPVEHLTEKEPTFHRGSSGEVEEGELSSDEASEDAKSNSLRAEGDDNSLSPDAQEQSSKVTKFYDNLARPEADRRDESPIKLMRNFNNWVKSILLRSYLAKVVNGSTALDLCCGKGGDLLKWKEGGIDHLVCADISGDSIEAAKQRYDSPKLKGSSSNPPPFSAEFYTMDCTKERLIDLIEKRCHFNISSCQFSLHYSFESHDKAYQMLQNACESLRPGGYFLGTTIDADQLVDRLRKKGEDEEGRWSISNSIFSVTLDPLLDISNLPLFGARYNFKLHDVVDLPEYLVHFPLLQKMLEEEFDMELVRKQNFYHFFQEHRDDSNDRSLLFRMSAFDRAMGTMTQDEWEVVGLYLVFVFEKKRIINQSTHHHHHHVPPGSS